MHNPRFESPYVNFHGPLCILCLIFSYNCGDFARLHYVLPFMMNEFEDLNSKVVNNKFYLACYIEP